MGHLVDLDRRLLVSDSPELLGLVAHEPPVGVYHRHTSDRSFSLEAVVEELFLKRLKLDAFEVGLKHSDCELVGFQDRESVALRCPRDLILVVGVIKDPVNLAYEGHARELKKFLALSNWSHK